MMTYIECVLAVVLPVLGGLGVGLDSRKHRARYLAELSLGMRRPVRNVQSCSPDATYSIKKGVLKDLYTISNDPRTGYIYPFGYSDD